MPYVDRAVSFMGYDRSPGSSRRPGSTSSRFRKSQNLDALDTPLVNKTFQIRHAYHFGKHYQDALSKRRTI